VYTFTKLHDRRIPNVGVGVRVGLVEFQLDRLQRDPDPCLSNTSRCAVMFVISVLARDVIYTDFQRFFILENVGIVKNVKKRKTFFTSMEKTVALATFI